MKCYHCNTIIPDNAAFCPKCGRAQTINEEMIAAAKRGDQSALSDLYNRTYNDVYNTIKFMVKDEDTVLDLLQDSYIKAFDSLDQLQDAGKFEAWIKRIAHNKTIDYLRKTKPVTFSAMVSEDSEEALEFEDDRPENLPEVVIDRRETTRLINEILDSLPDDQRVCISLFYYDQLSTKEIAYELGIPEATVKSRLQYGRKKVETQVLELEKKGTKLYGLAPVTFLMLLFLQQPNTVHMPSSAVLQSVLAHAAGKSAAAGTAAVKAGGSAVKSVSAHSAVHAVKAVVTTKIIAAVAAVAVIGGGTAAVLHYTQQPVQEPTAIVSSLSEEPIQQEVPPLQKTEAPLPPHPEEAPVIPDDSSGRPQLPHETALPTVSPDVPDDVKAVETVTDNKPEEIPAPPAETETPKPPAIAVSWSDAYQSVLDGYQACMSGGLGGTSPYLQYQSVRYALEVSDGSRAIVYGLHDVNNDGVPELILAMNEEYAEGIDWSVPFEIYTCNGDDAVPLCPDILESHETLHIGANGVLWIDSGNSGFSPTTFYEFPKNSIKVKETDFFDTVSGGGGSDYYQHISNGVVIGKIPRDTFWSEWIPADADITYYSILKSLPSSAEGSASADPHAEMIAFIKSQLGIPADLDTEDIVDFENLLYWEAADMWLVNCEFYYNGTLVACAQVDPQTGELARNILMYTG